MKKSITKLEAMFYIKGKCKHVVEKKQVVRGPCHSDRSTHVPRLAKAALELLSLTGAKMGFVVLLVSRAKGTLRTKTHPTLRTNKKHLNNTKASQQTTKQANNQTSKQPNNQPNKTKPNQGATAFGVRSPKNGKKKRRAAIRVVSLSSSSALKIPRATCTSAPESRTRGCPRIPRTAPSAHSNPKIKPPGENPTHKTIPILTQALEG